jgi:hypothetical protein
VREYLVRHLPQSLRVSRGFVCSTDPATRVSPEVDVLITGQESELPWFAEGGLIIVPPSAARGQIHVKTEFRSAEITDVLEAIFSTCESCEPQRDPSHLWSGAIFLHIPNARMMMPVLGFSPVPCLGTLGATKTAGGNYTSRTVSRSSMAR